MSTKTISKRVALATVVALGAGVLSLVSVSSASAVGTNTDPNAASPANPTLAATSTLYVASANSTLGVPTAISTVANQTTLAATTPGESTAKSFGLLSVSDLAGTRVAGTTQTATLLSNGAISVYDATAAGAYDSLVVSGGTLTLTASPAAGQTLNNTATIATARTASNVTVWGAYVKPNAGVSSFTISLYSGNTDATSANATSGTLSGFITVSVATTSVSGTLSQSKSGIYYTNIAAGSSVSGVTADSTAAGIGTSAWNVPQTAAIVLKDAYSAVIAAGGLVTATATNGAYVALGSAGSATSKASAGTSTTDAVLNAGNTVALTVAPSVTTASTTTVTISYQGVVVGTKAFTFTGKVAKVTLSAASNGVYTTGGSATISFADSAGNAVYPVSASPSYPQSIVKDAATAGAGISLGAIVYPISTASGSAAFGCGAINSTGNLVVDYVNADSSVVVSNSLPVSCSGSPASYSAKFDKASYNSGDIATLTVTFKDATGALAADVYTVSGGVVSANTSAIAGTTTNIPNIVGSNLTNTSGTSTTAGSATDVTTNGVAIYKFIVGSTSGAYQAIVDFPKVDSATQSGLTVAYSIASSGTSLNDVLKGIVSLIASINKQIAALAKLVTKK